MLECIVRGEAKTREGFGKVAGTYHQTVITALAEALGRFRQPCKICICTEDEFVLNMIKNNLKAWEENDFLTSKGKPVANQEGWKKISSLSKGHKLQTEPGKHTYSQWIQEEIQKRKEKEDV